MQASSPNSARLWADFVALCDCGGRRAGSTGEQKALALVKAWLAEIGVARSLPVRYAGWRLNEASLVLEDGARLACVPLLGSQSSAPQGLRAEVRDLGRGRLEDFERCAAAIPGRIVLVRHEYPFSAAHVHRRRKLAWAMERGAAGFIIANPDPAGAAVSGSSGRGGNAGIPAAGTDCASAARLCAAGAAVLTISGEDHDAETSVLTVDLPGREPRWVVLSAHVDGHALAESAMDNASGVATALAVARACAPRVAQCARGLRVCIFSAEEWALAGSKQYLDAMPRGDRAAIALNINLDTVGGDSHLTALTSEFRELEGFVR